VRHTEGQALPAECFAPEGGHCCIAGVCRLQAALHEAVQAFYLVLDGYTLADLVHNRGALAKVLFVERRAKDPDRLRRSGS
jgi:Rrf2 family nitric oxide-sensitive transcriptional repressor